jgi:hypothetical protein
MDKCMGKWGCWFYDCHPGCVQEVCESLEDVSAPSFYRVRSVDRIAVSSGLWLPLLEGSGWSERLGLSGENDYAMGAWFVYFVVIGF